MRSRKRLQFDVLPLQIVVNSLVHAVPAIVNVMLVCLIFWLIFSIVGYQLFSGKFYRCVDNKTLEIYDYTEVEGKKECNASLGMRWMNAKINFDNSLQGFLALFQVVRINLITFKAGVTNRKSGREVAFASTSMSCLHLLFLFDKRQTQLTRVLTIKGADDVQPQKRPRDLLNLKLSELITRVTNIYLQ